MTKRRERFEAWLRTSCRDSYPEEQQAMMWAAFNAGHLHGWQDNDEWRVAVSRNDGSVERLDPPPSHDCCQEPKP